jgi:hypothetical protein
MTREETKQDIHHLYGHWPGRTANNDSVTKGLLFYEWLKSMDTGVLSFGNFGEGVTCQHITVWIEEWEKDPESRPFEH